VKRVYVRQPRAPIKPVDPAHRRTDVVMATPAMLAEWPARRVEAPRASPAIPKPAPVRSASWLAAVRSLPFCVLCGFPQVDPAHRNEGKGSGTKTDDCTAAAICRTCHREIDQGSRYTRDERRALIDRAIVLTLIELVKTGRVGVIG
jgi:hypothetical protein